MGTSHYFEKSEKMGFAGKLLFIWGLVSHDLANLWIFFTELLVSKYFGEWGAMQAMMVRGKDFICDVGDGLEILCYSEKIKWAAINGRKKVHQQTSPSRKWGGYL